MFMYVQIKYLVFGEKLSSHPKGIVLTFPFLHLFFLFLFLFPFICPTTVVSVCGVQSSSYSHYKPHKNTSTYSQILKMNPEERMQVRVTSRIVTQLTFVEFIDLTVHDQLYIW